jgi:hypothetical protein
MKNNLNLLNGFTHRIIILQVTGNKFDSSQFLGGKHTQQTRVSAGIIANESTNPGSFRQQAFHQVAANKTTCTGHQNAPIFPM